MCGEQNGDQTEVMLKSRMDFKNNNLPRSNT